MQSPTYLLSHRIVRNNSTVDSSFPAPQHLRLLPVLGNSLIPWVLGSSRDLFPSTEAKRKQVCVFSSHSLAALAPVWMPPPGTLYLEQVVQRQEDGPRWSQAQDLVSGSSLGNEPLAATAPATGGNQTFPGAEPGLTSQLPVYLGSCPFSTPGSLAFLLTLWTTQYPFSNFLFLSLQELVPIYL